MTTTRSASKSSAVLLRLLIAGSCFFLALTLFVATIAVIHERDCKAPSSSSMDGVTAPPLPQPPPQFRPQPSPSPEAAPPVFAQRGRTLPQASPQPQPRPPLPLASRLPRESPLPQTAPLTPAPPSLRTRPLPPPLFQATGYYRHHERVRREARANISELEAIIKEDLDACRRIGYVFHREIQGFSRNFVPTIVSSLRAIKTFIPRWYLIRFINPCWELEHSPLLRLSKQFPGNESRTGDEATKDLLVSTFSQFHLPEEHWSFVCFPVYLLTGFPKSGVQILHTVLLRHYVTMTSNRIIANISTSSSDLSNYSHIQMLPKRVANLIDYMVAFHKTNEHFSTLGNYSLQHPEMVLHLNQPKDKKETKHTCTLIHTAYNLARNIKLIIMMRNPIDYIYSDFWYTCSKGYWRHGKVLEVEEGNEIFHNLLAEEVTKFNKCMSIREPERCVQAASHGQLLNNNICRTPRLGLGVYFFHVIRWLDMFPRAQLMFLRTEDLVQDMDTMMTDITDYLQLDLPSEMVHQAGHSSINTWLNSYDYLSVQQLTAESRDYLLSFLGPYNTMLARLLDDDKYLWLD